MNPFLRVRPGDAISFDTTAENAKLDAAQWFARNHRAAGGGIVGGIGGSGPNALRILIKNASGADVNRFGVLGIDGPLFDLDPADPDLWISQLAFKGVTP